MAHGVASIHVRTQRKRITVTGMGQTNRGTKYIKNTVTLEATKMTDKDFKRELSAAVHEIIGSEEPMLPFPANIPDIGG